MNILPLFLRLISGGAAGNIIGSMFPNLSLGPIVNSIVGMIGGGIGGRLAEHLCARDYTVGDTQILLCCIAGGAAGGSLLTVIVGFIKNIASRRS